MSRAHIVKREMEQDYGNCLKSNAYECLCAFSVCALDWKCCAVWHTLFSTKNKSCSWDAGCDELCYTYLCYDAYTVFAYNIINKREDVLSQFSLPKKSGYMHCFYSSCCQPCYNTALVLPYDFSKNINDKEHKKYLQAFVSGSDFCCLCNRHVAFRWCSCCIVHSFVNGDENPHTFPNCSDQMTFPFCCGSMISADRVLNGELPDDANWQKKTKKMAMDCARMYCFPCFTSNELMTKHLENKMCEVSEIEGRSSQSSALLQI